MTNRCLLGAGVALIVALGGAQAQAQLWPTGAPGAWYIGPEGGWTKLTNQTDQLSSSTFTGPGNQPFTIPPVSGTVNYNSGFSAGARGGYQWGPWRFEEEYSYRHSQVNSFTGGLTNIGFNNVTGQRNTHALMTNAIYDFTIGWPISPHIGAGIGAVDIIDSLSSDSGFTLNKSIGFPISPASPTSIQGPQTFGGTLLHGSTWQFGYQAIAGIRYDFSPAVSFDLDYRYLATTGPTITNNSSARFPFPSGTAGTSCCVVSNKTGYNTQNIVASVTMKFGAPPAPPPPLPPAPPPPPAQNKVFLVFFDWDKYNITPEGERIIQLAAQQYKAGGAVKIQVNGYTDTTGSFAYNQRLSERRANAVASRLAALGVAKSDMAVVGHSFNDLRVPTPLGVREPQNRRVEIVFPL
jgi:outer membrane protein OmpA-like peptidoglycan-associated protein